MSTIKHTRIATILLLISAAAAQAGTLRVPSQYASIQAAMDEALPGDTVEIANGQYAEDVIVSARSGVSIKPARRATVTVRSMALAYCHRVRIEGLQFAGGFPLLSLWDCDDSVVQDCGFRQSRTGVALNFSDRTTLYRCRFEAPLARAVSVAHANRFQLKQCVFVSVSNLYLLEVSQGLVQANQFDRAGLIDVRTCDRTDFYENELVDTSLHLKSSNQISVEANAMRNSSRIALILEQDTSCTISRNQIRKCREGIQIVGGGGHNLFRNDVRKCQDFGIRLWSSGNIFKKNVARKNGNKDLWDSSPKSNTYIKNNFGKSNVK